MIQKVFNNPVELMFYQSKVKCYLFAYRWQPFTWSLTIPIACIANAFSELPLMRREVLRLLFVEMKTPREIAAILYCSEDYVSLQKTRALKKLRKMLEEGDNTYEYESRRDAGMLVAMDYTFSEWADFWFEHHKNRISVTTQEGYSYTLRNLKAYYGRKKLSEIKAYDIEQYLMKLVRDGKSGSTVAQSRGMLFQIFRMAVANDILMKNPVAHAEKIRRGPPKGKDAFTADEVRKLMKELPEDKIGWSIRLMLATGMRTQELLALEPRHIAKDGSSINIAQAIVMEKGSPTIGPTKTHNSLRTIPVPETVRYCARNLRDTDGTFIWESPRVEGKPINPSYFRDHFREYLKAIEEVRVLTPHCCRHTYVTHMLALGVDPKTVQALVGHAEIDMTMYYAHAQESSKQEAISRYDEAFSAPGGGLYGNVIKLVKSG